MAMHVVAERRLGIPQSNAHALQLLERDGMIGNDLAKALGGMVGFRNVAIHQYDQIDLDILRWIIRAGHRDWIRLAAALGVQIRPWGASDFGAAGSGGGKSLLAPAAAAARSRSVRRPPFASSDPSSASPLHII